MISKENREKQTFKVVENYALHNAVGSGTFGKVYKSTHLKHGGDFAIKVVPVEKFKSNPKLEECTLNEITILSNIPHSPHIVKYIEMLKTANNFYFIYQFCNGGSLSAMLTKEGRLSEEKAIKLFDQLLQAFRTLQDNNIMHRDVKPDNILFHDGQVKLGDFGFCKTLAEANAMTGTMLGSPIYMAPEVIRGQTYTSKADIWSLGVVLFQMLFGYCPYESKCIASLISSLQQDPLKIPTDLNPISTRVQKLLKDMLCKDSAKRISWQALLNTKAIDPGMKSSMSTQPEIPVLRSGNRSKGESVPLEFAAKKKTCSTSETNPQKQKVQAGISETRTQSSKSQLRCVTNTFSRQSKKYKSLKVFVIETDTHKQCIKGLKLAVDLAKAQDDPVNTLLTYCILRKIDSNLSIMKEENSCLQRLRIVESQQLIITSQLTSLVSRLVQLGFSLNDLNDPESLVHTKTQNWKAEYGQPVEVLQFLGWASLTNSY